LVEHHKLHQYARKRGKDVRERNWWVRSRYRKVKLIRKDAISDAWTRNKEKDSKGEYQLGRTINCSSEIRGGGGWWEHLKEDEQYSFHVGPWYERKFHIRNQANPLRIVTGGK